MAKRIKKECEREIVKLKKIDWGDLLSMGQ
jgi:hypothetical protein